MLQIFSWLMIKIGQLLFLGPWLPFSCECKRFWVHISNKSKGKNDYIFHYSIFFLFHEFYCFSFLFTLIFIQFISMLKYILIRKSLENIKPYQDENVLYNGCLRFLINTKLYSIFNSTILILFYTLNGNFELYLNW